MVLLLFENEVRLPRAHDLSWRLVECPSPFALLRSMAYVASKHHRYGVVCAR